jgi:hypothetical protein
MVWTHQDFVRELRRQLVEIESLRKKLRASGIAGGTQLEESLKKLEDSNRQLIRKIAGVLEDAAKSEVEIKISGVFTGTIHAGGGADDDTAGAGVSASVETPAELLLACLKSILDDPEVLEHLLRSSDDPQNEPVVDASAAIGAGSAPSLLQERCGGCGKLLVSSVLAGEKVVRDGEDWYHEGCLPSHEGGARRLWQPTALN